VLEVHSIVKKAKGVCHVSEARIIVAHAKKATEGRRTPGRWRDFVAPSNRAKRLG
jgi:hypothetical protein